MTKKIIYIFILIFFTYSCESMKSAKRGLTGEKQKSTDEFLIQKKDPLILPPDYENLPVPEKGNEVVEQITNFEKTLGSSIKEEEEGEAKAGSVEDSILRKIRSK